MVRAMRSALKATPGGRELAGRWLKVEKPNQPASQPDSQPDRQTDNSDPNTDQSATSYQTRQDPFADWDVQLHYRVVHRAEVPSGKRDYWNERNSKTEKEKKQSVREEEEVEVEVEVEEEEEEVEEDYGGWNGMEKRRGLRRCPANRHKLDRRVPDLTKPSTSDLHLTLGNGAGG
ncbi:hypothetical protein M0804_004452 [Polistes exclamans]|nr:hypothetical protein M0804_004452 [Polistes exclamans]